MLRIRTVKLQVETALGPYGTQLSFPDGLSVISADNTKGKSTALQAIIYGLGLERMLSPRREIPLPHAMTTEVEDVERGQKIPVVASSVSLELLNGDGHVLTVRRAASGNEPAKLIQTWNGPRLTRPSNDYVARDYFVRDPGAASREAGFHRALAEFVGWRLPKVSTYDGDECLLFLEVIFPLLFVEQKRGWTVFPAQIPGYFGIKDAGRRAVEFVLGFETFEIERRRQAYRTELEAVEHEWRRIRQDVSTTAARINGTLTGIPMEPVADWPAGGTPHILVGDRDGHITAEAAVKQAHARLEELAGIPLPTTESGSPAARRELDERTAHLNRLEAERDAVHDEQKHERLHADVLERRKDAIEADLARNRDAKKLTELGSSLSPDLAKGLCPTCHQHVTDTLVPTNVVATAMTVDENVKYLEQQRALVQGLLRQLQSRIASFDETLVGLRTEMDGTRARIRFLKQSLIAPSNAPSLAALHEQVTLEGRVRELRAALDQFDLSVELLLSVVKRVQKLRGELAELPKDGRSDADIEKQKLFSESFVSQARDYGFTTFAPAELSITDHTFKPAKEGYELGFEVSASDLIRLKWAYHLGLLEVARVRGDTAHLGLLVMDEPRQQSANPASFAAFLKRASRAGKHGQQVIVATSEKFPLLDAALDGVPHTLLRFDGKLITRSP